MEVSGRNLTPDKLPADERAPLFTACDQALAALVRNLAPDYVVGIGKFAAQRAAHALPGGQVTIGSVPAPEPCQPDREPRLAEQ